MIYTFFVSGQLPDLNKIIDASKGHWSKYNNQKAENDTRVALAARHLPPLKPPCDVVFDWYEPNERRDPDNIAAAHKFVFDGLVKSGKLKDDGRKEINAIADRFHTNKEKVGVLVTIFDQGEER